MGEESVEQLLPIEVEGRDRMLYTTLLPTAAKADYEHWLETDGILLSDMHLEKKQMKVMLNERISTQLFYQVGLTSY